MNDVVQSVANFNEQPILRWSINKIILDFTTY